MILDGDNLVPLRVAAITDGGGTGTFNLVMQEITGSRRVVMSVGLAEAQSIAVFTEGIAMPRPLTHDLMTSMLKHFGIKLTRVIIGDLRDGYFITMIVCDNHGMPYIFESRTSDAVSLALRNEAPIFIREEVLNMVSSAKPDDFTSRDEQEQQAPDDGEESANDSEEFTIESFTSGQLADLPVTELREMLSRAIDGELYEQAQIIQEELKRRGLS